MEPDLKALMQQKLAGYEAMAKVHARELASMTDAEALVIMDRLRVYSAYPERDPLECGLIEQQAIFSKARHAKR